MRERADERETPSLRWALVIAALIVVAVRNFVPFGRYVLYPFTLLATWAHEMGHGLTGLATLGRFDRLEVFADASGLAHGAAGAPWAEGLRAMGGLLAPPILGTLLLVVARGPKRATVALWILAAVIAISVPIWVRSLTGWIALPAVALAIGAFAWRMGPTSRLIGAHFLAVLFGLDTVTRIDYLFKSSVIVDGRPRPSDVAIVAEALGGHWLLWGILLALVSLALLGLGVWITWRGPKPLARPSPETPARQSR
ncbi:MAG: M50 family metallopeptidase [Sandaracinaceae bacterium]|nr:M50 family metallopeptidase [Sandaracinaceae bacterium]